MREKHAKTAAERCVPTAAVPARIEYSAGIVDGICARIASGEALSTILAEPGQPAPRTFFGWIKKHPEAADSYEVARRCRAEVNRDKIAAINDKLEKGLIDPQSAREIAANLRWMASKDAPKAYSERVELTGAEGAPMVPERERDDLELARYMALVLYRAERQLQDQSEQGAESLPLLVNGGS
jgi:hypothetical protein